MTLRRGFLLALPLAVLSLAGCSQGGKPGPLAPEFATVPRTQKDLGADPLSGADQPGALYRNPRAEQEANGGVRDNTVLSKTVQENVTSPGDHPDDPLVAGTSPATRSTTGPTTQGISTGQFLTIGGVVADVNSTPIYANKVLTTIEPLLAAQARDLDASQFRLLATREINKQIIVLCRAQLEYAAAERNLDQKDKDMADMLTIQWKKKQETTFGSLEVAKREAKRRGLDFDEMLQDHYRLIMSQIFLDRKITPRIQVNAADIRAYYDRYRDTEFSQRGVAQFRLIKIDVRKHDGRENAQRLVEELRNRIVKAGERFESVARSVNDDPRLLKTGGDVGKIEQGAFHIEPVDKAVWATPDGQVTPVIDTGDALYIAQVEEKTPGKLLPFEDESVQEHITETLQSMQFRELREKLAELVNNAIIRQDKDMINIAVDMAMQNYPRWAGK